jgi:hypothetical protein
VSASGAAAENISGRIQKHDADGSILHREGVVVQQLSTHRAHLRLVCVRLDHDVADQRPLLALVGGYLCFSVTSTHRPGSGFPPRIQAAHLFTAACG